MNATREPRMPIRGSLVDQLEPGLAAAPRASRRCPHLVGDVVQPRSLLGQEPAHGRVGRERREQLDVVLADVQQHRLHALLLDDLAVGDAELEAVAVELQRGLDLLDGHADVVDAAEHGRSL